MSERLLWPASLTLGVGTALLVVSVRDELPELVRKCAGIVSLTRLDSELRYLRSKFAGAPVVLFVMSLALIAFGTALVGDMLAGAAVLALLPAFAFTVRKRAARRAEKLSGQVLSFLDALGRALEASPSVSSSIFEARMVLDAPLAEELEEAEGELSLGLPLEDVLVRLGERARSKELSMALLTLRVAKQTGGNVGEVLARTSASLRERRRLAGLLQSKTAEGRAQAWVISIVPFPLVLAVDWVSPEFFAPLLVTTVGAVLVVSAGVCWVAALVLARRILRVEL